MDSLSQSAEAHVSPTAWRNRCEENLTSFPNYFYTQTQLGTLQMCFCVSCSKDTQGVCSVQSELWVWPLMWHVSPRVDDVPQCSDDRRRSRSVQQFS